VAPEKTPEPPYWAVVFTSLRPAGDAPDNPPDDGYEEAAARMMALAREQPGFLGADSVRGADGLGITVSYWRDPEAIAGWRAHPEHLEAQAAGRERWYRSFSIRVCRVERAYGPAVGEG
jgi:heme-degrading monooxygenase HmoA